MFMFTSTMYRPLGKLYTFQHAINYLAKTQELSQKQNIIQFQLKHENVKLTETPSKTKPVVETQKGCHLSQELILQSSIKKNK